MVGAVPAPAVPRSDRETDGRRRARPQERPARLALKPRCEAVGGDPQARAGDDPEDPSRADYRQGGTLGEDRKHWFRAKLGGGRFRLFFRYSSSAKIIIYAWVNDETTLRTYGAKTDAYAVFRKMLDKGNPPDDWAALLAGASSEEARLRTKTTFSPESP